MATRIHRGRNQKLIMLNSARRRARQQGLPFDITEADFDIPAECPVLGLPLAVASGNGRAADTSPSLDRIIPEQGYVRGNVVVVSWRANRLKSNGTLQDFRQLVDFYELIMGHTRARRMNPA